MFKIYKQLIKFNITKTQTTRFKKPKQTLFFSKEDIQMAMRHVEICSASLIIRDMKIQATMRYHLTSLRMAIIENITKNKYWRECGEKGALVHCQQEFKLVQRLWKTVQRFPKKLNIELQHDPAILLPDVYLKKTITLTRKDVCYVHPSVDSSIIYNSHHMETTEVTINR